MGTGEILINQMYAGEYLAMGNNIGHEVINLLKADDGKRYLYVTPNGKVQGRCVESILFVRKVRRGRTVEVVAAATELSKVPSSDRGSITYSGVRLADIYGDNTAAENADDPPDRVTYVAENMKVPSPGCKIILTLENKVDELNDLTIVPLESSRKSIVSRGNGMRRYYTTANDPVAYKQLKDLLGNERLWCPIPSTYDLVAGEDAYETPGFLEVIGKEDSELVFSSLFTYVFSKRPDVFREFASEILNIDDMDTSFRIDRESKNNIDIRIEDSRHIVVIENKTKSGINGVGGKYNSQLKKYQVETDEEAVKSGKESYYFVFAPDVTGLNLRRYDPEGIWTPISYSDICNFFKDAGRFSSLAEVKYFDEFLRGLEHLALSDAERNFRIMRSRFLRRVREVRDSCR